MKIIATGGHLSPLLSVVGALNSKEDSILVIGRKHALEGDKAESLEYKTLKKENISFKTITTGRFQRRFTRYTLSSFFKLPIGFFQALNILKEYHPDVVLSFGGYISLPVMFAAYILNIPVVIHEQTLEAGFSNKAGALIARRVCISWESSKKFFPKEKTVLTGNPIREFRIKNSPLRQGFAGQAELRIKDEDKKRPIIYITGGSLGSHQINLLVEGCLKELLKNYVVIHQCGDAQKFKDFERLEKLKNSFNKELSDRYFLTKFVDPQNVGSVFKKADLVISRSGMNTVTELIFFGKPSYLIPLAFAQGNEQMKNAQFLKSLGIGEVCEDEDITSDEFCKAISQIMENLEKFKKNGQKAQKLVSPDSARKIIEVLKTVKKR